MAAINFIGGSDVAIQNLSGSGLGFFGSTFGASVPVGSYQDTTWITDGNGVYQGPQCDNVKYTHANSGSINGAASVGLQYIPNYLATLQIQFTHTSAVKTQNAEVRIYDRSSINNPASGVTCKAAEIIHPNQTQNVSSSSDSSWTTPTGSSVVLSLMDSPGVSGLSPNGSETSSTQHDWYVALSASPNSTGSKTMFGAYASVEYL